MRVLPFVLSACCGAAAIAAPAFADTYTYTYTGQTYQLARGAYTTSERVTGELTLAAPLGPGMVFNAMSPAPLTVLSFSFSDGVQTLTDASASTTVSFVFGTNTAGLPTQWYVDLYQTELEGVIYSNGSFIPEYGFNQIESVVEGNLQQDSVFNGYSPRGGSGWVADNQNAPGTWTVTVNTVPAVAATAAPEPGSLGLVVTGLGVAGWLRRRR